MLGRYSTKNLIKAVKLGRGARLERQTVALIVFSGHIYTGKPNRSALIDDLRQLYSVARDAPSKPPSWSTTRRKDEFTKLSRRFAEVKANQRTLSGNLVSQRLKRPSETLNIGVSDGWLYWFLQ